MKSEYQSILADGIEKKYRKLEEEIEADIVRRIKKAGEITETADWQLNRYIVLGHSTEDVEKIIREAVGDNDAEVQRLYEQVIEREYTISKDLYTAVGKEFVPYENNYELQQMTNALIQQSNDDLYNISKSLGFKVDMGGGKTVFTPLSDIYNGYIDDAMVLMTSGAFDYNTLIRKVVGQLTASGLRSVDYASGWSNRADVAARRALLTGMSQLTGQISKNNAAILGTDFFEVDWHMGARPDHAVWQGKVYSSDELVSVCGLGEGAGLLGWNCRHTYYPFIKGVSVRNYTDEWLEEQNAREAIKRPYRGKEYNTYEATQKQRQMETAMRAQREKVDLLKKGGADKDTITDARCKYQAMLDEYKEFSAKFKLPEQRERIYYDLRGRVAPSKQTYDKWRAEKAAKAAKRAADKERKADIAHRARAEQNRRADMNAARSKRDPGIPASWAKGEKMDIATAMTGTNPNYQRGGDKRWTHNCQRCVSAFEARVRGYDVEALPRILNGSDDLPYMNSSTGWLSVYKDATVTHVHKRTGEACKSAIEAQMAEWGDDSRAIVRVVWHGRRDGHVFIATQQEGKTLFIDPQSARSDCSTYFASGMIKPTKTELVRIDNLDFTDRIELCAKMKE